MPYAGKQLQPRDIVALVNPHWPNQRVKATATCLAESQGYVGAWHDNLYSGRVASRDCGLFQINIPSSQIGTQAESNLRTESLDPADYMPVAKWNVDAAYRLWARPWTRDGKKDYRRWQPWVAYSSGWAMFPESWVWHQQDGEPVGPWIPTGRYLHKACRAVANWHLLINGSLDIEGAKAECKRLLDQYGATDCGVSYSDRQAVYVVYPPKPTSPPEDGVGPRPKENDGL
jgi:hypothetical protein